MDDYLGTAAQFADFQLKMLENECAFENKENVEELSQIDNDTDFEWSEEDETECESKLIKTNSELSSITNTTNTTNEEIVSQSTLSISYSIEEEETEENKSQSEEDLTDDYYSSSENFSRNFLNNNNNMSSMAINNEIDDTNNLLDNNFIIEDTITNLLNKSFYCILLLTAIAVLISFNWQKHFNNTSFFPQQQTQREFDCIYYCTINQCMEQKPHHTEYPFPLVQNIRFKVSKRTTTTTLKTQQQQSTFTSTVNHASSTTFLINAFRMAPKNAARTTIKFITPINLLGAMTVTVIYLVSSNSESNELII